jgi:WD40 repeat protein
MSFQPIEIFFSYSHKDQRFRDQLETQLSVLKREGLISTWYDRKIGAGEEWAGKIDEHLNSARIILLLVSADFIASDYCYDIEMKRALERHEAGEAKVIPIILRWVNWQIAPFSKLQALPRGAKPVTAWTDRDEAFFEITREIRGIIEDLSIKSIALQSSTSIQQGENPLIFENPVRVDWGEALIVEDFYGRENELSTLKQWIVDDCSRIVALLGMGGIGKTALTVKTIEKIKSKFDYIIFRSLQHTPPLESVLRDCVKFLSDQKKIDLPKDVTSQILLFIEYLRQHRCLLVLDNFESLLQGGSRVGQYREGFEGYGRLIQLVGEAQHNSCLLLASREKPKEVALLEGSGSPIRSLLLSGVGQVEGQQILKKKGLSGSDEVWAEFVRLYSGNPLALKVVAATIREVFNGDIVGFLRKGNVVFGDIYDTLDQQFHRLTQLEQEIMYWLGIGREGTSLDDLEEDIVHVVSKGALLVALDSLRRRSMIEISSITHFTLQPVIMEYITNRFVEKIFGEIDREILELFESHALIKARAKDYIRHSQLRFILQPLANQLLTTYGKERTERKFKNLLSMLRENRPQIPGYAAGNILNLLAQFGWDLHGYDFSRLTVWQAYLQGVALPEVNFSYADLTKSLFTDTLRTVISVALSPNGELLVAGFANGEIRSWHPTSGTPIQAWRGHTDWTRSITFNSDGSILASGGDDQTIRLWEVSTGQCLKVLQGHSSWVYSVAFNFDGSILASGGDDQTVRLWEVSTGQCLKTLQGHDSRIYSVAFNFDGSILASGGDDQTIRLWEVSTGQCLKVLQGHSSWVYSVAFNSDGSILASGGDDQTVRLWEVSTGQCIRTLRGHTNWIWSVAFSRDGTMLASGSSDQTIRLWDVNTGQCLKVLQGYTKQVRSIAFSPDGQILASGGEDKTVQLWEVSTGQRLKTLHGHNSRIYSIAFSPDGQILASGGDDKTVRLWEVSTGQCLKTLHGHDSWVWSVCFSPDGSKIISGSEDQTARLWEVTFGECLITLPKHGDRVYSVAFSPDGKVFTTGNGDGTIRFWDAETGQYLKMLRSERPYEGLNITGARGLTSAQKTALRALGAIGT